MSLLTGVHRAILGAGARVSYILRATFDADDVGFTDGQVLNTQPEMGAGYAGQLTVVEVDGTLAIVSRRCAFTAQGTPIYADLMLMGQGITRSLGLALLGTINLDTNSTYCHAIDWHTVASPSSDAATFNLEAISFRPNAVGDLDVLVEGSSPAIGVASYSTSTDYTLAIVLGGADSNGVPWRSGQAAASHLYGARFLIKGGAFSDWTLLWATDQGNTATLYGALSNYDAAGTLDNFRVPDADLSDVLQPNNLSLFASAGELSAYAPELGSVWVEDIGDWDTAGGVLQATALGIATFTGLADCLYDAKITTPGAGTTAGGLVLREVDLTGGSEDYWYVKIKPGTAGTDWELIEYVGGAATQRASGDVDWAAATAYAIRAIQDGQEISCFADGNDRITYGSAASGETATSFGLRDEGNANMTFDNVALFARTSSVYEATLDYL